MLQPTFGNEPRAQWVGDVHSDAASLQRVGELAPGAHWLYDSFNGRRINRQCIDACLQVLGSTQYRFLQPNGAILVEQDPRARRFV